MIMEQLMREKLLTVKKEMEGFMKESVPFWLENGIDKEYGGYLVCFDSKGKLMKELAVLTPEDKMIVTQTRMIWGFSALLRNGLAKRYGWEEKCKEDGAVLVSDGVICQEEPDDDAVESCKALDKALA